MPVEGFPVARSIGTSYDTHVTFFIYPILMGLHTSCSFLQ